MRKQDETQEQKKSSFITKYLMKKLITCTMAVLVLVICAIGLKKYNPFGSTAANSSKTTKLGFEDIGELATQTAYCTEVNVTEAANELFGVVIPFTQSKYVYSYDIEIKAGFDFNDIEWSENYNTIIIKLPETKILSSEIKFDTFKVYYEKESIFRQISLSENNAAMQNLKQTAEENAIANGLLKNARNNAETILRGFFAGKYNSEEYEIEFTDK